MKMVRKKKKQKQNKIKKKINKTKYKGGRKNEKQQGILF